MLTVCARAYRRAGAGRLLAGVTGEEARTEPGAHRACTAGAMSGARHLPELGDLWLDSGQAAASTPVFRLPGERAAPDGRSAPPRWT
ncbi:hypothetical protein JGS39_04565 [Streptomyces sp. P01-B04]|uniref:hypothetical protein n=1 Tax=Streptomyces poriferorum TaxID=2798799 RepID=UPI001C5FD7C8|nr:hypothetical protein [Streptomyces poriferorum]MBW5248303.1 hypothetical protein [Streptomyces poriferorum]MBW5255725.1 hypothetical protein [Streptomyces poriferorum]